MFSTVRMKAGMLEALGKFEKNSFQTSYILSKMSQNSFD